MHPPKAEKKAFLPAASNLFAYYLDPGTRCSRFYPADSSLQEIFDDFDEDFNSQEPRLFGIELTDGSGTLSEYGLLAECGVPAARIIAANELLRGRFRR